MEIGNLKRKQQGVTPSNVRSNSRKRTTTQMPACLEIIFVSNSGGSCRDSFDMTSNRNGAGGQAQAGIASQEACNTACLAVAITTCAAYDYDTNAGATSRCWFFTTAPATLGNANGVNHYRREACDPSTFTLFSLKEDIPLGFSTL